MHFDPQSVTVTDSWLGRVPERGQLCGSTSWALWQEISSSDMRQVGCCRALAPTKTPFLSLFSYEAPRSLCRFGSVLMEVVHDLWGLHRQGEYVSLVSVPKRSRNVFCGTDLSILNSKWGHFCQLLCLWLWVKKHQPRLLFESVLCRAEVLAGAWFFLTCYLRDQLFILASESTDSFTAMIKYQTTPLFSLLAGCAARPFPAEVWVFLSANVSVMDLLEMDESLQLFKVAAFHRLV